MRNPRVFRIQSNGSRSSQRHGTAADNTTVAELLLDLAAGFGDSMSDRRLRVYGEALEGISLEAVRRAYSVVRDSDELSRMPPPGRFRAIAVGAQKASASRSPAPEVLAAQRATIEEVDEIFAELQARDPDSTSVRLLLTERETYKGQSRGRQA
jgi:hypothetical protein